MPAMKIGLITTLDTNIGDDFIREGICHVLTEVFKGQQIEFISVNKHKPLTVYPRWHPIHLSKIADLFPIGSSIISNSIEKFISKLGSSRFDNCDLIIQCGAPVFWPNCHQNEWAEPLWHHVIGRLYKRIPVLNLAAGSCYPWERQPTSITEPDDARYLKTILSYCRLTTVRDTLSKILCESIGTQVPLIPCSASLAARGLVGSLKDDGIVLINYMSGGGHYDWEQNIDPSIWHNTIKALVCRLQKRHKLAFLCHNETEYKLAKEMEPTIPRLFPKTPQEYFSIASDAKVAVCNRMHASVGLAGMGVPSIAVGTDTRLLMVKVLGLPSFYVKETKLIQLEDEFENLLASRYKEKERLLALCSETWKSYAKAVSAVV